MNKKIYKLDLHDFADIFGTDISEIPADAKKIIKSNDFRYRKLTRIEKQKVKKEIKEKIESGFFSVAGRRARQEWQGKWTARLKAFTDKKNDFGTLTPNYYYIPKRIQRLFGDLIEPLNRDFENNFAQVYRLWLFSKYFKSSDNIYEFGCGTGLNACVLARLFPNKKIFCSDWVSSSKKIIELLAKEHNWKLSGFVFDMFKPDPKLKIKKNSAFLTFSALEQLGRDFKNFVDFAIKSRVGLFVTVDGFIELYDQHKPFDRLAVELIKKRNYLQGYLAYLKHLERRGLIEIIKIYRVPFGNMFYDNYSYAIWQPRNLVNPSI